MLLSDVPPGCLNVEGLVVRGSGLEEHIISVTDPGHTFFSGHGAECVWPAAVFLAKNLIGRPCVGLKVVELGAGVGLPGLMLARAGACVTLTDVPWLLPLVSYNVEVNFPPGDPQRPEVATLRWGNSQDAAAVVAQHGGAPDLIIASDVVYREEDFGPLLETISALGPTEVLMAMVLRDNVVQAFGRHLREHSWCGVSYRRGRFLLASIWPPCPKLAGATRPLVQATAMPIGGSPYPVCGLPCGTIYPMMMMEGSGGDPYAHGWPNAAPMA